MTYPSLLLVVDRLESVTDIRELASRVSCMVMALASKESLKTMSLKVSVITPVCILMVKLVSCTLSMSRV